MGIRPVAVGMIMAGFLMYMNICYFAGNFSDFAAVASFGDFLEVIKPVQIGMARSRSSRQKNSKVNALTLIVIMGVLGAFLCKGEIL